MQDSPDRRPIRSRETPWAEAIAQFLVNRRVSPNAISLFGMFAALAAGVSFLFTDDVTGPQQRVLWLLGAALCQIRLLCNLFDGMVAIQRKVASPTGELYNEIPDRISDAAVFIGLGYSAGGNVALGYLAALLSVFVAYVRAATRSIGAPNDFCGPMAKPQRMAIVTFLAIYMTCSPASWRLTWGETNLVLGIVICGGAITAWRRLTRAARFLKGTAE